MAPPPPLPSQGREPKLGAAAAPTMAIDCRRCRSNTRRCEPPPGLPSMITRLLLPILLMTNLPAAAQAPTPPDVTRKAHVVEPPFGATRDDNSYSLRDDDRKDKAMPAYPEADNDYAPPT